MPDDSCDCDRKWDGDEEEEEDESDKGSHDTGFAKLMEEQKEQKGEKKTETTNQNHWRNSEMQVDKEICMVNKNPISSNATNQPMEDSEDSEKFAKELSDQPEVQPEDIIKSQEDSNFAEKNLNQDVPMDDNIDIVDYEIDPLDQQKEEMAEVEARIELRTAKLASQFNIKARPQTEKEHQDNISGDLSQTSEDKDTHETSMKIDGDGVVVAQRQSNRIQNDGYLISQKAEQLKKQRNDTSGCAFQGGVAHAALEHPAQGGWAR